MSFTSHLRRVAPSAPVKTAAATLRAALATLAPAHPMLTPYLVDDQGRLRKHVAVFVDGALAPRAQALDLPIGEAAEVHVMQALSGG
ncbi:MAG: MoaD/ThiS family protein [Hyphomicrobiales bacterium]|nr:MoaD/ThiS family protein [Hyphomicrobiales bacterium]